MLSRSSCENSREGKREKLFCRFQSERRIYTSSHALQEGRKPQDSVRVDRGVDETAVFGSLLQDGLIPNVAIHRDNERLFHIFSLQSKKGWRQQSAFFSIRREGKAQAKGPLLKSRCERCIGIEGGSNMLEFLG